MLQLNCSEESDAKPQNRSKWLDNFGRLNPQGIVYLHSLFTSRMSTYQAAKEIGLSYRAVALIRKRWKDEEFVL